MLAPRPSGAGGPEFQFVPGNAELRGDPPAAVVVHRGKAVIPRWRREAGRGNPFRRRRFGITFPPCRIFPALRSHLATLGRVLLGYSGGVDSALLAVAGRQALGPDRFLAVIGRSPSYPEAQYQSAVDIARRFEVPLLVVDTEEMADPNYRANPSNRCYFCKAELWTRLGEVARSRGFDLIIDGTNADDLGEHRPGLLAAGERTGALSTRGAGVDQGHDPVGRARTRPAALGRARRSLPVEPGRSTAWRSPRRGCARWRRESRTCADSASPATCGSATTATGPGSRSSPWSSPFSKGTGPRSRRNSHDSASTASSSTPAATAGRTVVRASDLGRIRAAAPQPLCPSATDRPLRPPNDPPHPRHRRRIRHPRGPPAGPRVRGLHGASRALRARTDCSPTSPFTRTWCCST